MNFAGELRGGFVGEYDLTGIIEQQNANSILVHVGIDKGLGYLMTWFVLLQRICYVQTDL